MQGPGIGYKVYKEVKKVMALTCRVEKHTRKMEGAEKVKSMKLTITYPQIYIESKEVEVPDEQGAEILNYGNYDAANFVFDNLTDLEQNCTYGLSMLSGAIDAGYCSIKENTKSQIQSQNDL